MTRSIFALAVAFAVVLTSAVVAAQKGQGGPKGPKVKVTQSSPKAGGGGSKLQASASRGSKVKATATKAHDPKAPKAPKSSARTTMSTRTSLTLTPVQQKLQRNTNLASKLKGRLPSGTNLMDAAEGFRNLGQFVAAVNVSNNLGIPFTELKSRMVDDGMSLGQAIKAERNDVDDVTVVVRRAERDAQVIIDDADEATRKDAKAPKTPKAPKPPKRDGR